MNGVEKNERRPSVVEVLGRVGYGDESGIPPPQLI